MIPNFTQTIQQLAMWDTTKKDQITVNEHIENNIHSVITRTDVRAITTTAIITIFVILIFLYEGYRIYAYCKMYVLKHVNRVQNA